MLLLFKGQHQYMGYGHDGLEFGQGQELWVMDGSHNHNPDVHGYLTYWSSGSGKPVACPLGSFVLPLPQ